MPVEDDDGLDELEDDEGKSGKGKLFLIIGLVVLILVGSAAAFFLLSGGDEEAAEDEEIVEEVDDDIQYETAYFDINRDIVSNVKGKAKYLRAHVQLVTNRADMLYEIEIHAPLYRHVILMTLIDKKGESIQSPKGKESLRNELHQAVSDALDEKVENKGLITDLIFTSYYVK